ncbi:MAG TPA: hypothetical protein VM694_00065 [Polyangium sp.]|nr:hypothetical protein [Polyangium sp.]
MAASGAPPPVRFERACALRGVLFPPDRSTAHERRLLDVVLARFAHDRLHFSDILEWSLSEDEHGVDKARFSYAFPGFVRAREEVTRTVLAWADGLGGGASKAARSVLRAARSPAVEQILVGYARGTGEGPPRAKFYLQFRAGAGPAALDLSRALLGTRRPTSSDGLPLHLLGLDVGPEGLAGAKLYFAHVGDPATLEGFSGPVRDALWIHRLEHPDDPAFETPAEIDFALAGGAWVDLANAPALAPHAAARAAFEELGGSFRLRARRASLALRGAPKLNLYYVLDETET